MLECVAGAADGYGDACVWTHDALGPEGCACDVCHYNMEMRQRPGKHMWRPGTPQTNNGKETTKSYCERTGQNMPSKGGETRGELRGRRGRGGDVRVQKSHEPGRAKESQGEPG